jgi:hypothetical protein
MAFAFAVIVSLVGVWILHTWGIVFALGWAALVFVAITADVLFDRGEGD